MTGGVRVEVRVRGSLGGDLLALLGDLDARLVPRHTALCVGADRAGALVPLLVALEGAGAELERVTARP